MYEWLPQFYFLFILLRKSYKSAQKISTQWKINDDIAQL